MSPRRRDVERRSSPLLVLLSRQPRLLVPVAAALLLAGVLFLPAALSLACSAVLLAFLGWLTYLSWPLLDGRGRVLRLATLLLLVVLAVQSAS